MELQQEYCYLQSNARKPLQAYLIQHLLTIIELTPHYLAYIISSEIFHNLIFNYSSFDLCMNHTWPTSEASPKVWKFVHLVSKLLIISSWVIVQSDVLDLKVEGPGVAVHEGDGHADDPGLQRN